MIIAVVGLEREARIVAGEGIAVSRRGLDLSELIGQGASGIISIGIAGALDPSLKVGDAVIATRVSDRVDLPADPGWTHALSLRLPEARVDPITAGDAAIATPDEKSLLRLRTSAVAADMESHIAAKAAAQANLPFAALRIISDEAHEALPPAAIVAMRADGSIDIGAVIGSLMKRPSQIPALIRTAQNAEIAFKALLRCRSALGAGLACPDLG